MNLSFRVRLAALLVPAIVFPSANAADLPTRKSGLWEIRTSHDGAGGPMTLQICIDQTQDNISVQQSQKLDKDMRRQCSRLDVKRLGDRTEIDSVCKFDKYTTTGHSVISGNLSTQYRMESTTRYEPAMFGKSQTHTVMDGKWLGPCKPGQGHGSMVFSGMPGGDVRIDPEQIRKMQQQYKR